MPKEEVDNPNLSNDNRVFNLSNIIFSNEQLNIFLKGIKFIPSNKYIESHKLNLAVNDFCRRLKLRDFFGDNNRNAPPFRIPSKWVPPDYMISDNTLEAVIEIKNTFLNSLKEHTGKEPHTKPGAYRTLNTYNVNFMTIQSIKNIKSIVIRKADKSSSFVILDKISYDREILNQLSNTKFYKPLDQPLHPTNRTILNNVIKSACKRKLIDNNTFKFLYVNETYNTRQFYVLPKIHKPLSKWTDLSTPPGRPIISDVNTESSKVAFFIDYYINKFSTKLNSYIANSYDFVNKIKGIVIENTDILVTGDVNSLYTNMNLNRTLAVVKRIFKKFPVKERPDDLLLNLLEFTLKNNDFEYNGKFYLQIHGCAMGKKYSPGLANLYLESLDNFILKQGPKIYFRYLDDIFLIWNNENPTEFNNFQRDINNIIPDIKVDLQQNKASINFLDVTIYKDSNNSLQTKVFFKNTDNRLLLHKSSCHPPHTFRGIIKSQFIRYKRLCSTQEDFLSACNDLRKLHLKLGYSNNKMKLILKEVIKLDTNYSNKATHANHTIIPFVIPYNNLTNIAASNVAKALKTKKFFKKDYRIIKAFSNSRNLLRILW